jgi:hypothetical protein
VLAVRLSIETKGPRKPKRSADLATTGIFIRRPINVSDASKWHSLFGDPVIPGSCRTLLKSQREEMRSIELVHGGPAVEPVTNQLEMELIEK